MMAARSDIDHAYCPPWTKAAPNALFFENCPSPFPAAFRKLFVHMPLEFVSAQATSFLRS